MANEVTNYSHSKFCDITCVDDCPHKSHKQGIMDCIVAITKEEVIMTGTRESSGLNLAREILEKLINQVEP